MAVLAVAQPLDGCVGGCVAGEVVAAQSLDRHDLAAGQRGLGRAEGRVGALHRPGLGRYASNHRRGPQSGQATGWAWKRRSAGSWYSAAQAGHIGKPAMVVLGRS